MAYNFNMDFDIWVDADSIPQNLRQVILRASVRLDVRCYFVADRVLADVKQFAADDTFARRKKAREQGMVDAEQVRAVRTKISMIVIETSQDAADNYIVRNSKNGDLCVTHDIPLAARLLQKGCTVIDDRGSEYTESEIKVRLGDRLVNKELRTWGVYVEQQTRMGQGNQKKFADMLDRVLTRLKKASKEDD